MKKFKCTLSDFSWWKKHEMAQKQEGVPGVFFHQPADSHSEGSREDMVWGVWAEPASSINPGSACRMTAQHYPLLHQQFLFQIPTSWSSCYIWPCRLIFGDVIAQKQLWMHSGRNKATQLPLPEYNRFPLYNSYSVIGNLFKFSLFRPMSWTKKEL